MSIQKVYVILLCKNNIIYKLIKMNYTNNFFYTSTVKDFLEYIRRNRVDEIVESMCDCAQKFGVSCGNREIDSWKNNFKAITELLRSSDVAGDAIIGFEYIIPVGGRIDCVLFGHGQDGAANMIHIELKQWSNKNVSEHYNGYTFCTDLIVEGGRQTRYESHPSAQAVEYQNHLLNHICAFENKNINLYGFAYCYNYQSMGKNPVLCDSAYNHVTNSCPLYCEDQRTEFAQKLNELIGLGKGEVILKKIVNSEIGITKRLQDAAKTMFDGAEDSEEFSLIGTQLDAYNEILGAIQNTDKENEKTVVIVKGGPGTGKSVIAMRLISGLAKTGNFQNIFYSTRSTSLVKGYKEILKNVSYANGQDCKATGLIKKNVTIKPHLSDNCTGESWIDALIVDEAHRIEKSSNDQNEKNKRNQTHLTQIMNMLFSSRVSVFFIDDFQSVKKMEIGTSENIKNCANNYYEKIIAENKAYLNGAKGAYHGGIPKVKRELEKAEENYQKVLDSGNPEEIRDAEKKIRSLKGELEYGPEWVKDATPSKVKVNVIEFELKDQFRCNGSNNYIDWVERVLYKTPRTQNVKLDRSKYEFEVFDSPSLMYQKVREMDDFGRFADEMLEKGYSYDDILKAAKGKEFKQKSRLLAGWCWPWEQKRVEENGDLLHEIVITEDDGSSFSIPWETLKKGRKSTGIYRNRYAKNAEVWLNDVNGINQTGCIDSAQGWEVDYIGVIIAGDLKYDPDKDCLCSNDAVWNQDRNVPKEGLEKDRITKNIYRVLMTRGKKGCYIYACDPQVREYIKRLLKQ